MSSPAAVPGRQDDPRLDVVERLAVSYGQIADVADGLTDATAMLSTRCAGWAVVDVLYHLLLDARRALVTFATPSVAEPDVDAVSYWRAYGSSAGQPAGTRRRGGCTARALRPDRGRRLRGAVAGRRVA